MVSLTGKACEFTLAGLFSFSDAGSLMNTVTLLGIDIGKHSFHLHGQDAHWNLKKAHRTLLGDPVYATINAGFGGIFVSSNLAPSMCAGILSNDKATTGTVINAIQFQQRRHVCTLRRGTERDDRCA